MGKSRATYSYLSKSIETLTKSIDSFSDQIERLIESTTSAENTIKEDIKATQKEDKTTKEEIAVTKKNTDTTKNETRRDEKTNKNAKATPYLWNRIKRGELGSDPIASVANGLMDGIASLGGPLGTAIFNALKSVGEFVIGKFTQYMVVGYENEMRAMQAITTVNVNTMKANLGLWQNSMTGAYEAQDLAMSSSLALVEAQNATALANKKLQYSWGENIILLGKFLDMRLKEMEMEQKEYEMMIKNATETIQAVQGFSKQIDEYLYKQDQAIFDYGRSVGLSVRQLKQFETRMLDLNIALSDIGRTAEDVLKIQSQAQQQSGRLINYSNKDYKTAGSVGKIMGDENVARFNAEMVLFNQSVESSANIMTNMYHYANRMGLSQKRLTQNVLNNMKLAEKYQFKGGIQGYIQLAKVAENLRFDLNKLGSVIEKIQTGGLEGIIKQSAQLQVLGGGYAMNADPFRMAFNAFSDPQGLVESIADMARGEGVFDRKTGQLTFGTASQMRMNAAAQQLNLSREDFMNMVRERDKKDRVSAALKNSRLSQDQKDAIANSAQWDTKRGEWYVNTIHGDRKSMSDLSNNPKLINEILSDDTNKQMVEYAKDTLSATERTAQATQYISALLGAAGLDMFNDTVDETARIAKEGAEENKDEMVDVIGQVYRHSIESAKESVEGWKGISKKLSDAYQVISETTDNVATISGILQEQYKKAYERYKAKKTRDNKQNLTEDQIEAVLSDPNKTKNDEYYAMESQANNLDKKLSTTTDARSGLSLFWQRVKLANRKRNWEKKNGQYQPYKDDGNSVVDKVLNLDNNETTKETTNDAFASAKGTPMAIAAKDITSIHDGLAMADKRDSAVFAKTGGPFDRLFNGVFNKINAVYDTIQHPEKLVRMAPIVMKTIQEMPQKLEGIGQEIKQNVVGGNNNPIKFEPLKIEMNGRLELSSGGNSVDIMSELQNNPLLVREIAKMISDSLSSKLYGGKSKLIPGQNSYFS